MNNTKCLVVTHGYFGDIMFATSLAEKLAETYSQVDYLIGFPQMKSLVSNNPYITNTWVSSQPGPLPTVYDHPGYDRIIMLPALNYVVTPCEEYQQFAGFTETTSEYKVYTLPQYDDIANTYVAQLKQEYNKPVVGIMTNWQPKTYLFTEEQYKAGIDVPNLGYGGKHRDIQSIVNELNDHLTLIPIGVDNLTQQQTIHISDDDSKSLTFEASLLKACDAFLGTDGGLATIAAGVGCKTIITGDFNHQLYGWNGVLKKIENPQLGPDKYFPKFGHITINPYYTDKQVIEQIIESIK